MSLFKRQLISNTNRSTCFLEVAAVRPGPRCQKVDIFGSSVAMMISSSTRFAMSVIKPCGRFPKNNFLLLGFIHLIAFPLTGAMTEDIC